MTCRLAVLIAIPRPVQWSWKLDLTQTMAEKEQNHRHAQQKRELEIDGIVAAARTDEIKRGQYLGFGTVLLTLVAGVVLAIHNHPIVGTVIGTGGIAGLASVFILGRDGKSKDAPAMEMTPASSEDSNPLQKHGDG